MIGGAQYARSIADLIAQAGQAQAEAVARKGQIWGNAIANIAPQVLNSFAQIQQQRNAAADRQSILEDRASTRRLQDAQVQNLADDNTRAAGAEARAAAVAAQTIADQKAMDDIFSAPGIVSEQGVDLGKAVSLAQSKAPHLVPRLMEAAQKYDEGVAKAAMSAASLHKVNIETEGLESAQREKTNQQGVRRMIGESLTARGGAPLSPQDQQTLQGMALQEGITLPESIVPKPLTPDQIADNARADAALKVSQGQLTLAQQREAREAKNATGALDVSSDVRTTLSGKKYIDLGDYQTPTERSKASAEAKKLGVTVVPKEVGMSLQAGDTARQNIAAMMAQIESRLPKDPKGRIIAGPNNKLKQYFQTDADLAAFNSWRAGAIQAVQALVERGMGFRLNQAEINMIMQNDMPQITDTVQTAQQRTANVLKLLDNKEAAALTKDRSVLNTAPKKVGRFTIEPDQ